MTDRGAQTIVLIHGLWMTPLAWEDWVARYRARGFQGGLANFTHNPATTYNFANDDRAPLLFIAGGDDHILPPAVQHENFTRNSQHSTAITAYKLFAGRDHFTCGEPGWEEIADFALNWALQPRAGELD
jgi:alpha-beta hydrolase superfamily lysophospholipase